MMPLLTHIEHPFEGHTNPELRRLDMINRARREEMDVMLFDMNPRHAVVRTGSRARKHESLLTRMRAGIGSMLVAAGNRIQSAT